MSTPVYLNKGQVTIPPGKKVIKAAEWARIVDAAHIVEEAKTRAEKIVADAMAVYDAKKKQGYNDGLEEGRLEHAEKIMETAAAYVESISFMEKSVAELVLKSLEKVIGEMDDRELIFKIVKTGISVARNEAKVMLKVSPHDVKTVRSRLDEIHSTYAGIGFLDVVADHRMKPGGCIIESRLGIVDAGIDTQMKAIEKAIMKRI